MQGFLNGACRALILSFAIACVTMQEIPAHAMNPDSCSVADLERMGDKATEEITEMIKSLEAEISSYQRMADDTKRRMSLAEQELQVILKKIKDVELAIRLEQRDGPPPPAHWRRDPRVALAELQQEVAKKQALLVSLRSNLQGIETNINFRGEQVRILKEKLSKTISAFRDLISNPNNHSRRSLYETACRLKDAADGEEVRDIMQPVQDSPPLWRRLLPDSSRSARHDQGSDFETRTRTRWGSCLNAIAALGGAIISFWPTDSAQAGEFNDGPVNYPIYRGPYMPSGGGRGSPICPPEEPSTCPPAPYTCPEEPSEPPKAKPSPSPQASPSAVPSSSSRQEIE